MSIILWIIFGLVAGAIASFIMPGSRGGILGSIILGIVGGLVGGYIGERFFGVGVTGFNFMSIVVAVMGAILVIFVGRLLSRG